MFHRSINPLKSRSFFILGPRGAGKSTYILEQFGGAQLRAKMHYIDLLEAHWETRYLRNPDLLASDLMALESTPEWVVIDEIQKVPKLLDIAHQLIVRKKQKFIFTGSSARKLKRSSANLLAGRAIEYQLFPLTHIELGDKFNLDFVLNRGSLPEIFSMDEGERDEYLRAYCQTYLKEEILQEQIVRNGVAFREFLEVAAQENGKALNFSKIARDIGVDTKTAQGYFQILEDTLVGFYLPAFHRSKRKSVQQKPKFYIFDLGVKRALEHSLRSEVIPRTSAYGEAFEHFVISETLRMNSYSRDDYQLSHYQTYDGAELDLVLHRGREIVAIEIKSTDRIDPVEVKKLSQIAEGIRATKVFYISQDKTATQIKNVRCLHWQSFFNTFFVKD